jgi:hypothetical protein
MTLKTAVLAPIPRARASIATSVKPGLLRVHYGLPATRADDFFRDFEIASLQAHGTKRIPAAHALLHLFVGGHFEVFAQFFI